MHSCRLHFVIYWCIWRLTNVSFNGCCFGTVTVISETSNVLSLPDALTSQHYRCAVLSEYSLYFLLLWPLLSDFSQSCTTATYFNLSEKRDFQELQQIWNEMHLYWAINKVITGLICLSLWQVLLGFMLHYTVWERCLIVPFIKLDLARF